MHPTAQGLSLIAHFFLPPLTSKKLVPFFFFGLVSWAWTTILLDTAPVAAREFVKGGILGCVGGRLGATLAEHNTVEFLLHGRLDPRVLAAQPVRSSDVWLGDLAVIFQCTVFEARDLTVVAVALWHISESICADRAGREAQDDKTSGAHFKVGRYDNRREGF